MELGEAIRARRGELGLTLEALAERAGVSRAMLSEIERGVKTPTIRVVGQIAAGLGTTVGHLIGEDAPRDAGGAALVRAGERPTTVEPRTGVVRQALAPALERRGLAVCWYIVPPGQPVALAAQASGAAHCLTIVRGSLEGTGGEDEVTLAEGDTLTLAADRPRNFRNPGAEACHLLVVSGAVGGG